MIFYTINYSLSITFITPAIRKARSQASAVSFSTFVISHVEKMFTGAALSLSGGVIGIMLSILVCLALGSSGVPASVNPFVVLVAAGFSAAVGVFFGY